MEYDVLYAKKCIMHVNVTCLGGNSHKLYRCEYVCVCGLSIKLQSSDLQTRPSNPASNRVPEMDPENPPGKIQTPEKARSSRKNSRLQKGRDRSGKIQTPEKARSKEKEMCKRFVRIPYYPTKQYTKQSLS